MDMLVVGKAKVLYICKRFLRFTSSLEPSLQSNSHSLSASGARGHQKDDSLARQEIMSQLQSVGAQETHQPYMTLKRLHFWQHPSALTTVTYSV